MNDKNTKAKEFERGKLELDFRAEMVKIAKEVSEQNLNRSIGITLLIGIGIGALCFAISEYIE